MLSELAPGDAPADRLRGDERLRALADSPWALALAGALIGLATWELLPLGVGAGLDPSAVNGVNVGARLGLAPGAELAWTYGPLGYLGEPSVAGGWTAALGVVYTALARVVLATSLLWAARRSFGLGAGLVLAYAVCAVTGAEAVPISIAVVWGLVALDPQRPGWAPRLLVIGGGALAGLEVLVKLNIGVEVLALVAVAALALPGRLRSLGGLAVSFAATAAALWLLSGQSAGDVDDYARSAFEIVSGYSAAMGTEAGAVDWDWIAAAFMIAGLIAATAWTTRAAPRAARAGSLALVGVLCLLAVKQGFVRHDVGHMLTFVAVLTAPFAALRWSGRSRLAGAAAVLAISLLAAPLTGRAVLDLYRPIAAAGDGIDQLRIGLDPDRRGRLADEQRAAARAEYGLDLRTLAELRAGGVHVEPWEASAAWAYDLDWDPLPVFQTYGAYTPELDRLDAAALAGPGGPELILRHLTLQGNATDSIDGRYAPYDAPATTRAMLCNYRAARTTPSYQVLARRPDRCGPETPVETVAARYNEPIDVPRVGPGRLLFARVDGLGPSGLARLRTLLYKDVRRLVALDDRVYRLVGATAADGLLVSAPPRLDFPAPFALAPNPATIAFGKDGGIGSGPDELTVSFFAVRAAR